MTTRIFYKDKPYAMQAVLLSQASHISRMYRGKKKSPILNIGRLG